jgi:hypothetical protein
MRHVIQVLSPAGAMLAGMCCEPWRRTAGCTILNRLMPPRDRIVIKLKH